MLIMLNQYYQIIAQLNEHKRFSSLHADFTVKRKGGHYIFMNNQSIYQTPRKQNEIAKRGFSLHFLTSKQVTPTIIVNKESLSKIKGHREIDSSLLLTRPDLIIGCEFKLCIILHQVGLSFDSTELLNVRFYL